MDGVPLTAASHGIGAPGTAVLVEELIKLGGTESVEVVNWLAMRGALGSDARPTVEAYYAHKIMGYGLQAFAVAS